MPNIVSSIHYQKTPYIHSDFPEKCRTIFTIRFDNTPAAGALKNGCYATQVIVAGNDIFDPTAGHGGDTVRNLTIWTTIYSAYNVTASRVRGSIRPSGAGLKDTGVTGGGVYFVCIPRLDTTVMHSGASATAAEYNLILHHPLAKVYRYDHHSTIPSRSIKIDVSAKTEHVLEYYDDTNVSADHAVYLSDVNTVITAGVTNAQVSWFWHIYMLADTSTWTSTGTLAWEANLNLDYYTELLGQKTVG